MADFLTRFRLIFIGDRAFYKIVLALILPVIVQNTITNLVNLLDNIMVGQMGTVQMSGVAIANQLIFVFNLTVFGGLSGASIFGAQFLGAKDYEGLRNTFRFKLWAVIFLFITGASIFVLSGEDLLSLFLSGEGNTSDAAAMLKYGQEYLNVMIWGLPPFVLSLAYSSTLRETGESLLPMKASIAAVFTNLCLNYVLIFGKLGFPALGVEGAAIATVISRYVELSIIVLYVHSHVDLFPFAKNLYRTLKIPCGLAFKILKKGMPLLANELLYALGVSAMVQIFSTTGLNVVAGLNISGTVTSLFNMVFFSTGNAVAVLVGQTLGAGEFKKAISYVWKLIFFSICISGAMCISLIFVSPFITHIYNTTDEVRRMARYFMRISAIYMMFNSISHCCYFTIRSGGKAFMTFLFDSLYSWTVCVPFAYVLTHFTQMNIYALYPVCYSADVLKSIIGVIAVRTGFWAQYVISENSKEDGTRNDKSKRKISSVSEKLL